MEPLAAMHPYPVEPKGNRDAWIAFSGAILAALIVAAVQYYKKPEKVDPMPPPVVVVLPPPQQPPAVSEARSPANAATGISGQLSNRIAPAPSTPTGHARWQVRLPDIAIPFDELPGRQFELARIGGMADLQVCATQQGIPPGTTVQVVWRRGGVTAGDATLRYAPEGQEACAPFAGPIATDSEYLVGVEGPFAPSAPLRFSVLIKSRGSGAR
jgi:hypothetical protein